MKRNESYPPNSGAETSRPQGRREAGRRRRKRSAFGLCSMVVLLVCSVLLVIRLLALAMLPLKYLLIVLAALALLNFISVRIQLPARRSNAGQNLCAFIALLLSLAMIYGLAVTGALQTAIEKIAGNGQQIEYVDVIVLRDDGAQDVPGLKSYQFGMVDSMDARQLSEVKSQLKSEIGTVKTSSFDSITALADALYAREIGVMLISDALISPLSDISGYEDFSQKTRIVKQYALVRSISTSDALSQVSDEPFLIYCSGTDARINESSSVCRSDVNIIAAVNPKSHQVLLLNTPRDYYVSLPTKENEKDKLTHAGLYGIESSIQTLKALYGIDIAGYIRVNFTGFEAIVDALGGISVWSDYDFTTVGMGLDDNDTSSYKSFTFKQGYNDVTGEEALGFARERYAFTNGDEQRGRNQMAVIRAILNKATSPAILAKYQSVLTAVTNSVATNISYDMISSLIQLQLRDNIQWNIVSYSVTGTADEQPCYSMPGTNLSVTIPSERSVENAKTLLTQLMAGEILDATQLSGSSTAG